MAGRMSPVELALGQLMLVNYYYVYLLALEFLVLTLVNYSQNDIIHSIKMESMIMFATRYIAYTCSLNINSYQKTTADQRQQLNFENSVHLDVGSE